MPRLSALGVEDGAMCMLDGIETAEELFMMAPNTTTKGVTKQKLEMMQVAVARKTGPVTYIHTSAIRSILQAGTSSSSPDANDDDEDDDDVVNDQEEGGDHQEQRRKRQRRQEETRSRGEKRILQQHPTALDHWQHMMRGPQVLSTGCASLDSLFLHRPAEGGQEQEGGGGLPCFQLCEIFGPSASGKTQTCLSIIAEAAVNQDGGSLYIDTNGSFCPRRMRQMVVEKMTKRLMLMNTQGQSGQPPPPLSNASIDIVMSRIKIAQGAHDEKSLISTLDLLDQRLAAGDALHQDLRVLVVDSLRSVLAPILGRDMPNGYYFVGAVGKMLNYLAQRYGLLALAVNGAVSDKVWASDQTDQQQQQQSRRSMGGGEGGGSGWKPALGSYWSVYPSTRLLLRLISPKDTVCEAIIYNATNQETEYGGKKAYFTIGTSGIKDLPSSSSGEGGEEEEGAGPA